MELRVELVLKMVFWAISEHPKGGATSRMKLQYNHFYEQLYVEIQRLRSPNSGSGVDIFSYPTKRHTLTYYLQQYN